VTAPTRRPTPKALLIDLDGTLLGGKGVISPRVANAVREVSARISVSIASGREPADVLRFSRELGLTAPQISDGGAVLLDPLSGEALWSDPLPPLRARDILTDLMDDGASFIATRPEGTITAYADIDSWELTRVSALDLDEDGAGALVHRHAAHPDIHAVKSFLPYNGLWAVDFTRAGVHKGAAAYALAELLGVGQSGLIAVGDSYNDVPMLEVATLKIVMGDAPEEIRAMADFVAPSVDEDGLATAIDEYIVPRL
jgi:HAD superfamily hydrolase (TIGR01484 family)